MFYDNEIYFFFSMDCIKILKKYLHFKNMYDDKYKMR